MSNPSAPEPASDQPAPAAAPGGDARCAKCGAVFPEDEAEGLCPRCMLSQAMQSPAPRSTWQPPTAEELARLLPNYRISRMLGRGGMGAVYQGTQTALDRTVAIKILSAEISQMDESFAERFKNEARAMAKLTHPGIVAVYDSGETADGMLYIVMEFIDGTDVARMIAKSKRLHTEYAMAITAHVCDALTYAHERGIIHRDIKPANIMVGYDGMVKVADFGLAKMSRGEGGEEGLTQSGMSMGTLHYMAPEALMLGVAVDHRADIYAVGVMLYQMLTGRLPQGLFELPSLQIPGLDPRYDGIIGRAMREDRELRYPSTLDMRHDLDAILTQPVVMVEAAAANAPAAAATMKNEARPQQPGSQPAAQKGGAPGGKPGGRANEAALVKAAAAAPQALPQRPEHASPQARGGRGRVLAVAAVLGLLSAGAFWMMKAGTGGGGGSGSNTATTTTTTMEPGQADGKVPFINTLGMQFVPVPIVGGLTDGQRVLFSMWETRVQDYDLFVKDTKRETSKKSDLQRPSHPVIGVTWNDAEAFCQWLTERERKAGKLGAHELYRLPSDHEWSCAVGIGPREDALKLPVEKDRQIPDLYPWGQGWPPPQGAGNFHGEESIPKPGPNPGHRWMGGHRDPFSGASPVGSFTPNGLGLYDLSGNAWEWCADSYDASMATRVQRGGCMGTFDRENLFSSSRVRLPPADSNNGTGFRCVLATAPAAKGR